MAELRLTSAEEVRATIAARILGADSGGGTLGSVTLRLHQANVLIKQGKPAEARALIDKVTEMTLAKQKQTLLDSLAAAETK